MLKITFMGAGSSVFAKNVLGDSMMTPALQDSVIALYDIDPVRLDDSYRMLTAIKNNVGSDAYTHIFQPLFAKTACDTQGGSETTGEMTATGYILKTAILYLSRVVCMTGPGTIF